MATLRDFLFAGDQEGRIHGWVWTNWYQVDWRRVNRRRRRASQATNREPLIPSMRPLNVYVDKNGSSLHVASGSGRFAYKQKARQDEKLEGSKSRQRVHHPGGVSCLHVSHARSGMELYSAGYDNALRIWSVGDLQGIVLMHTIDLQVYNMCKPRCLNVSQTADVGAAWYAPSHGFHAAPTPAPADSITNPMEAKRMKRTRGSRNKLPPKIYVAGERFKMTCASGGTGWENETQDVGSDGEGGKLDSDGDASAEVGGIACLSPAHTDMSNEVVEPDQYRYVVQAFDFSDVRSDRKNRMEKAAARYVGHTSPISPAMAQQWTADEHVCGGRNKGMANGDE